MIAFAVAMVLCAKPPPDERQDLLDAMVQELNRSTKELRLGENPAPYFISYQLKDHDNREVASRYGALYQSSQWRDRRIFADVRVGDYAYDNSVSEDFDFNFSLKGNSYITRKSGPLDSSIPSLRTALWLITDERYKSALFNFLKKKGEDVYSVDDPKRPPSFSKEKPEIYLGQRQPFAFTKEKWEPLTRTLSAKLSASKDVFDSEVRVSADHNARWFVNNEGARLVTFEMLYGIHLTGVARADDGQLLEAQRDFYAPTEEQLPDDAKLEQAAAQMVQELSDLRKAPAIDPYTGPAILEPDAAGVLFHEAVGHRLEGERQEGESEGKTFRGQIGKPVLPAFLSISDDPTLAAFKGEPLNGNYLFDEEGVKAQRVVLIENGVLRNFLLSRKPTEGFAQSNGHGRAASGRKPVARMANLLVESKKQVSRDELKKMLIAEAKRQGKPYGLIIRDINGGNTNTSSFGYQAFKGVPRMVYRVDVRDGKETLVRGVEIVGTPLSTVNKVIATGNAPGVFNGFCGAESGMVPVSTVAPAALLQEIELQRVIEGKDRPPLLPKP